MIATRDGARQAALAYHRARANRDVRGALEQVWDEVIVEGPAGRVEGVLGFVDGLRAEFEALERTDLVAVFADADTALLVHDDRTLTGVAHTATHVTVEDGRITVIRSAVAGAPGPRPGRRPPALHRRPRRP